MAAVLALASAVAHVLAVDAASLASLAMAGLALVCLPCGWHLWRAPVRSVWAATVAVDLGMLAVHAPMAAAAGGHDHGHASPWPGLLLVTASLLLGLAVLARGAARRAPGLATGEAVEP